MRLNTRLQTIAEMVKKDSSIVDIGTDHGYIPIYLYTRGIARRVIATDISQGSLRKAEENIEKHGLAGQIELRLGYGFSPIKEMEVDTAIIGGMGGNLITEIMSDAQENIIKDIKTFILQPMVGQDLVRKWLTGNEFKIINERLAKEGEKYYHIIMAEHGDQSIENEFFYELGELLIKNNDPFLEDYLKMKINKIEGMIDCIIHSKTENAKEKRVIFETKLFNYKEVIKCLAHVKK